MAHDRDTFDYLVHLLEQEFAIVRGFLILRTGDSQLASALLHEALVRALCADAGSALTSEQLAGRVLKIALNALRHRPTVDRARATRSVSDPHAVLADCRELLLSTTASTTLIQQVIESFARSAQREFVRRALDPKTVSERFILDEHRHHRAATRLMFRANRRLRIAMHQYELRQAALDLTFQGVTLEAVGRRALRRRAQTLVIQSGNTTLDVDAWLIAWLQQPTAALDHQRPDECLRTKIGQQRLSDEYLREVIHQEQDRLQLRSLLSQDAVGALTQPADAAYFEELRRRARGE